MYKYFKRISDTFLAGLGLLLLTIPMFIIAIIIKIDSKGPALFKQIRTGKDGKPFVMYKFRTMKSTNISFDINNPVIESDDDDLTIVGKTLRRLKIDELPQLINVVKGDMSLIGPRPFLPVYVEQYEDWEFERLKVQPGMTGLAQLNGNGYLPNTERSYYDICYAHDISFLNDCKILIKTILILLFGEKKFYKNAPTEDYDKLKADILADKEGVQAYKQLVLKNSQNSIVLGD